MSFWEYGFNYSVSQTQWIYVVDSVSCSLMSLPEHQHLGLVLNCENREQQTCPKQIWRFCLQLCHKIHKNSPLSPPGSAGWEEASRAEQRRGSLGSQGLGVLQGLSEGCPSPGPIHPLQSSVGAGDFHCSVVISDLHSGMRGGEEDD